MSFSEKSNTECGETLDEVLENLDFSSTDSSDTETETISRKRRRVSPVHPSKIQEQPKKKIKLSAKRKIHAQRPGWNSNNFNDFIDSPVHRGKREASGSWNPKNIKNRAPRLGSPDYETDPREKKNGGKNRKNFQDKGGIFDFNENDEMKLLDGEDSTFKQPQTVNAKKKFKTFIKSREEHTERLFEIFNQYIFDKKLILHENLKIEWAKTLNKTAGQCCFKQNKNGKKIAIIRLSTKILDTYEKLKQTFCHELIHAICWLIENKPKPPHGPIFQKWAKHAQNIFPDLKITTCHSYQIHYKYQWQCEKCKKIYGRHSKSIDVKKSGCGACSGGRLQYLGINKRA